MKWLKIHGPEVEIFRALGSWFPRWSLALRRGRISLCLELVHTLTVHSWLHGIREHQSIQSSIRQSQNVRWIVVPFKRSLRIFFLIGIIIGIAEFIWITDIIF